MEMSSSDDVVIVYAGRTPIGSFKGALASQKAHKLGSIVIKELINRTGVTPSDISEIILGQVLTAGQGQNGARQAAVGGGIPYDVPASTVNMVCGSGMRAIVQGFQAIRIKDAAVVIAGGQESMSQSTHCIYLREGTRFGDSSLTDTMMSDGLIDAFHSYHMGITAENVAKQWQVTREEQDRFAVESQIKYGRAQTEGYFNEEIVPVPVEIKKVTTEINTDEHPRPKTTFETLQRLKPAFIHDGSGTVTAGNCAGLNDGAAAVLLMSNDLACASLKVQPLARIVTWAQAGVDPSIMGIGPIPAIRKALQKANWSIDDVDLFEINEAFAAQSIVVAKELGLDMKKVNVNGGSIALGHPIGASGARIVVTLVHALKRLQKRRGIAALCIGGGMGIAMCVERM